MICIEVNESQLNLLLVMIIVTPLCSLSRTKETSIIVPNVVVYINHQG